MARNGIDGFLAFGVDAPGLLFFDDFNPCSLPFLFFRDISLVTTFNCLYCLPLVTVGLAFCFDLVSTILLSNRFLARVLVMRGDSILSLDWDDDGDEDAELSRNRV